MRARPAIRGVGAASELPRNSGALKPAGTQPRDVKRLGVSLTLLRACLNRYLSQQRAARRRRASVATELDSWRDAYRNPRQESRRTECAVHSLGEQDPPTVLLLGELYDQVPRMRKALASIMILLMLPGCAAMQDWHYGAEKRLQSELAWATLTKNPYRILCPSDYGHGWKEGFRCIATGATGNPPTLAPDQYWSVQYQSPEGQEAIAAWFAGFHDGAVAAGAGRVGLFHYIGPHGMPAARLDSPSDPVIERLPPCPDMAYDSGASAADTFPSGRSVGGGEPRAR